jgi:hypothetical protein
MPHVLLALASLATLASTAGCSNQPVPIVGEITVTNASGLPQPALSSMQHGQSIYLDVLVTHDIDTLGVDWSVTCSSSLSPGSLPAGTVDTSCGVFVPNHTASGPVPSYPSSGIITQYTAPAAVPKAGTVTIVAHSTSDPSSLSSITLTIT